MRKEWNKLEMDYCILYINIFQLGNFNVNGWETKHFPHSRTQIKNKEFPFTMIIFVEQQQTGMSIF